jgi:hypothetical protein
MEQGMSHEPAYALALGALASSIHTFRILVNRGLVSPNEVEGLYSSISESMQDASPQMAEFFENRFQEQFAELRQIASQRWVGKGHPDPEPSPSGRR